MSVAVSKCAFEIHNGDCAEVMKGIDAESVDAIVTDPPYGLSFMGKEWDSFGTDTRQPGDEHHLASDNTYGRSKVRYGWNQNKSKLRDSMEMFQHSMTPIFAEALRVSKPGAHLLCFGGTRTFHRMACAIEDAGWEIRDCIMWVYGSGFPKSMDVGKKMPEWQGWGTCLKPAWEPIVVARKSLDGTVAHNVMAHGTGAINIDGCRVQTDDTLNGGAYCANGGRSKLNGDVRNESGQGMFAAGNVTGKEFIQPTGRFPANLVHDGSNEVLGLFPNNTGRFFYCAKASKKDRGEGNDHPTVKPNSLMRWLVRLVCPQGGTVLDPFMGSGSTGVACVQEGAGFVGIDLDEHYCEIAGTRLNKTTAHGTQMSMF